jgi:hypothetical protein
MSSIIGVSGKLAELVVEVTPAALVLLERTVVPQFVPAAGVL